MSFLAGPNGRRRDGFFGGKAASQIEAAISDQQMRRLLHYKHERPTGPGTYRSAHSLDIGMRPQS